MPKLSLAPVPDSHTSTVIKKVGKFDFSVDTGFEVPADIPKGSAPNDLPFREVFADMDAKGHNSHSFVPTSFWTSPRDDGGRGVEAAKVTVAWQKEKLRGAFSTWKKKDDLRARWQLVLVPRVAGDMDGKIKEPGLSMFLVDSTKR